VAVTIHFEERGVPVSMLLDLVKVVQSHTGINLAAAFAKILDDFGISDKVIVILTLFSTVARLTITPRSSALYVTMPQTMIP